MIFAYPEYIKTRIRTQDSVIFIDESNTKNIIYPEDGVKNTTENKEQIVQGIKADKMTKFDSLSIISLPDSILGDTIPFIVSNDPLTSSRIDRWRFSYEYYIKNYNCLEKTFGGGFDYLKAFGSTFFNDPDHMDYPHNTLISSVLYSGILGGIIYLIFIIQSLRLYFKFRKYNFEFFLFYLVTFFFVFFSSNSHFELPLFTFLSLIPFLVNYLAEKGKTDS